MQLCGNGLALHGCIRAQPGHCCMAASGPGAIQTCNGTWSPYARPSPIQLQRTWKFGGGGAVAPLPNHQISGPIERYKGQGLNTPDLINLTVGNSPPPDIQPKYWCSGIHLITFSYNPLQHILCISPPRSCSHSSSTHNFSMLSLSFKSPFKVSNTPGQFFGERKLLGVHQ